MPLYLQQVTGLVTRGCEASLHMTAETNIFGDRRFEFVHHKPQFRYGDKRTLGDAQVNGSLKNAGPYQTVFPHPEMMISIPAMATVPPIISVAAKSTSSTTLSYDNRAHAVTSCMYQILRDVNHRKIVEHCSSGLWIDEHGAPDSSIHNPKFHIIPIRF